MGCTFNVLSHRLNIVISDLRDLQNIRNCMGVLGTSIIFYTHQNDRTFCQVQLTLSMETFTKAI